MLVGGKPVQTIQNQIGPVSDGHKISLLFAMNYFTWIIMHVKRLFNTECSTFNNAYNHVYMEYEI